MIPIGDGNGDKRQPYLRHSRIETDMIPIGDGNTSECTPGLDGVGLRQT